MRGSRRGSVDSGKGGYLDESVPWGAVDAKMLGRRVKGIFMAFLRVCLLLLAGVHYVLAETWMKLHQKMCETTSFMSDYPKMSPTTETGSWLGDFKVKAKSCFGRLEEQTQETMDHFPKTLNNDRIKMQFSQWSMEVGVSCCGAALLIQAQQTWSVIIKKKGLC